MSFRRRAFATMQLFLAILILVGSSFEVLNLVFPSLVPQIQDAPLMRLHHAERVVFYWTIVSNIASAILAVLLIRGAIGTLRNRPAASQLSRHAIRAFFVIVAGSAVVSGLYLLPPILVMLGDPRQHSIGLILLISVFSSLGGLAVVLSGLLLGHRFILRQDSAAA